MTDCVKTEDPTPFEEALNKTGNGLYNVLLSLTCALILLAIGIDLFGFSLVVTAACDLDLTVAQKGILTSAPFVGILLVSYVWGYISDTRGRKYTLLISLQAGFLLSCLSSLSPNWIMLAVVKFLAVCFSCAANSATYTLVGESCVQRVRNKYMLMMTSLLLLSPAVAALLTYPTLSLDFATHIPWLNVVYRPWRLLIVVLALPMGVGAVGICFFHESPKFLTNWDRKDEALVVLKAMYAVNKRCDSDGLKVHSIALEEKTGQQHRSLVRAMYEQSAPLFRRPLRWKTVQLFYIVAVVYITNNSFLVWLPHILNLVRLAMDIEKTANICGLIATEDSVEHALNITTLAPQACTGRVESNVIVTLIASQCVFSFLNVIIAQFPDRRKAVLMFILALSAGGGVLLNLMPEPISSVFFFVVFTCTCLGMGILASFFVDLYPTSYRGMVACLSIMVGRTSTFIGINLVGNILFNHCQLTFYLWSLLVLSSVVAAWFLPPDRKPAHATDL